MCVITSASYTLSQNTERFTARKSFNERIKNEHERDSILNRGELYHSKREKEMEKEIEDIRK